jgi:hypothetical protein
MASKQKLLIVDDEEALCEVISATAQAMGFECIATTDAKTFLDKLGPVEAPRQAEVQGRYCPYERRRQAHHGVSPAIGTGSWSFDRWPPK